MLKIKINIGKVDANINFVTPRCKLDTNLIRRCVIRVLLGKIMLLSFKMHKILLSCKIYILKSHIILFPELCRIEWKNKITIGKVGPNINFVIPQWKLDTIRCMWCVIWSFGILYASLLIHRGNNTKGNIRSISTFLKFLIPPLY